MEQLLEQAEQFLREGEHRKAALTAKKVLEEHDFNNQRAWEILRSLAGTGETLMDFQQRITCKYYPDRELDVRSFHQPTDQVEHDQEQRKPCPYCAELIMPEAVVCRYCGRDLRAAPAVEENIPPLAARLLSAVAILCGGLGLLIAGLPLGVAAIGLGGVAYLLGAKPGLTGVALGIIDVVFAMLFIAII